MRFKRILIGICLLVSLVVTTKVVRALEGVNTLSSITIDGKEITGFDSNKTTYDIAFDSSKVSVNIGATRTDASATLEGDIGVRNLNFGINTFKITVTSEDKKSLVYTLNITRKGTVSSGEDDGEEKSSVNTLKSLTLSQGTLNFDPNVVEYNVTVEANVSKVDIKSELTDSKSKYVPGFENRTVTLKTGVNPCEIRVQAENGSINIYRINIIRKEEVGNTKPDTDNKENNNANTNDNKEPEVAPKSSVNTLKSLTLSGVGIDFKPEITNYEVSVPSETEKIRITSELTDNKAKYVTGFGNRTVELKSGVNEILIKIEAENGDINTYTIKVTLLEEDMLTTTKIKSLEIENHNLDFDNKVTDYTLKIQEKEMELNITIELLNDKASYEILNNENLQDGDKVVIRVTSEDQSQTKDFNIKVSKEKTVENIEIETSNDENDFFARSIYLGVGVFLIGIIFLVISLLFKKKMESK